MVANVCDAEILPSLVHSFINGFVVGAFIEDAYSEVVRMNGVKIVLY